MVNMVTIDYFVQLNDTEYSEHTDLQPHQSNVHSVYLKHIGFTCSVAKLTLQMCICTCAQWTDLILSSVQSPQM